jgi:hypothetical protein
MFLLYTLLAHAEGARCVATWQADAKACGIEGSLMTSATGPSMEAAERLARRRLGRVAELTAEDLVEKVRSHTGSEFFGCAENGPFCFITLDDPECWDGTVLTIDDQGWRAVLAGRQMMCEAVDARQVRLNYTHVDERRTRCQESCAIGAVVSCPPVR